MVLDELLGSIVRGYRVVHSIPGRIRLQLPLWKHVPNKWRVDFHTLGLVDWLPGIRDFHLNSVTGTVLITYDTEQVSEHQILHVLDEMARLLWRHRKQLARFRPEQRDEALAYMSKLVEAHGVRLRAEGHES